MTQWPKGADVVQQLLDRGHLQSIAGAATDGYALINRALTTLETARSIAEQDPDTACVLAYDAARYALVGLLAQQGLRPTIKGGHLVIQDAMNAQFEGGFKDFGVLRRRRNDLEYPDGMTDSSAPDEARWAIDAAEKTIDSAQRLIGSLGFFSA